MPFEKDPNELGALWIKEGKKGPYMTGTINGVKVVCFKVKKGNNLAPDWRILKSVPREQSAAAKARMTHRASLKTTTSDSDMSQDPAVFVATVKDDGRVVFDNPTQLRNYLKAKFAGQSIDVLIAPTGLAKTRSQENGLHVMLEPWARSEGHRIEDLKRDILRAVFGEIDHTNPITGEVTKVLVEPHTSKLSRAAYAELITRSLEIAAECGVVLEAPSEFRERREQAQRKARREQATT